MISVSEEVLFNAHHYQCVVAILGEKYWMA